MAIDYNASLIADLYLAESVEMATRVCDEMVEIGDAIFPRQIYEAYKKFRKTSLSHYFVSDLTHFKTGESAEILKEIANTTDRDADISMIVDYLTSIEYFNLIVVKKVKKIFNDAIVSGEIDEYDLNSSFTYLEKSNENIEELYILLKTCFENDRQSNNVRRVALKKLLKLKSAQCINFYHQNYSSIKGKKIEIIFVEEISNWKGGIVPSLHQKILEIGSERAKEILQAVQSKNIAEKQNEEKKEQEDVRKKYETADIISDIAKLRYKINKVSFGDIRFGSPIFLASEEIYQQCEPAKDKATLVGYCIVLRSLLGGFDKSIIELEISKEKAQKLLPEITEFNGSINKFHLLLLEREIKVDPDIFGLRNINRIVSKLAHPEEEAKSEFINILKKEKLFDYYQDDSWSRLHREILLRYKNTLVGLLGAINEK